ncbi:Ribosomal RNA-processing protein 9 [Pseudozyma hubeiensis]|nr:Ribosomal RNA-processing protein 9 [Pseudozyma hubeiensis]
MPDAFFQKKRKRTSATSNAPSSSRAGPSRTKPSPSPRKPSRKPHNDSDDDDDSDVPGGGIDDMDLSHRYDHDANSDEEADAAETPAEARVRLAKMYLQGLSSSNTPASAAAASGDGNDDDFFESDDRPTFGLADAAQADRDNIAARLQKDVAEQSGKIHLFLADRIVLPPSTESSSGEEVDGEGSILAARGHRLSVTSAVASSDAKWLFTASKDGSIIRYRLRDGKMMRILPKRPSHFDDSGIAIPPPSGKKSKSSGAARRRARLSSTSSTGQSSYLPLTSDQGHTDEIWSLSLSSDGRFLASAGVDRHICIWSLTPTTESFHSTLSGHKDSITSLSFRSTSHELYTASLDRTLKLYDVSQLSYIETLFGHQESVLSLSCLSAETAVSAGGRDRTCRYWKIRDESQLVFRAGIRSKLRTVLEGGDLAQSSLTSPVEAMEGSVEVVSMIDSHHFVSGGDSGTISLWNLGKKKPIFSIPVAHGFEVKQSETEGAIQTPRWITSLAALEYADVFVSGSWDGWVRVWGLTGGSGGVKGFRELGSIPAEGVVNSLQLVQPPLPSVFKQDGLLRTSAVRAEEYKRKLADEPREGETHKLTRLEATKQNSPPILIAGVGKEHKFGRWIQVKSAKNQTLVVPLQLRIADEPQAKPNGRVDRNAAFKLV